MTQTGPVSGAKRRTFANLSDGTYYWSVQAIDAGFTGSLFAPETSFTYYHPTVSTFPDVLLYPGTGPSVQSFTLGDADSPATSLVLTAFSSNTNFLNTTNIVFSGSGSNRIATISLPPGSVGTSMVSVVETDITGLTATNIFKFEAGYFSDTATVFSGSTYYNSHWADYDNDGDLDVFYGGFIYRNDGNAKFTQVASPGPANWNGVVWGDYDRDGDQDFAWADGATLRIVGNDGDGVFTTNTALTFALGGTSALAWGDYDNDGDLDLAVSQPGASRIYRNDAGTFTLMNTGLPPCSDGAIAWGDFDNDGDLDLLIAGLGNGPVDWRAEVYRNDGGGVFTSINSGFFGVDHASVSWGDYDNDGYLDALVTGFNFGSYVLKVYHNNGNGTFNDINVNLQGVAYSDASFADFDNDGFLDIHLNGCIANLCASSIMGIYHNNRDGTFSDLNAGLPPTTAGQVGAGDYDNDGDLDLLANRLYLNNCTVSNTPPATPPSPVAQLLPDNAVLLTWQASSDLQTTNANGLSYDVRVGTTHGGVQLVAPSADITNGYRRVPQRGAVNNTSYLLRDVPRGTFYWNVQAVDPTFAGSHFSAEGSFVITNARPVISAVSNQVTVPGRSTTPISFNVSDLETPATNLKLSGFSTNTALVSNANIVFGGAGSNRTVTLIPTPGVSGTTTISISVKDDGGLMATSRFDLVVQTFLEVSVGLPASTALPSVWGDYDNDGDLDIAMAGTSYTTVYRNVAGLFTNNNFTLPAANYYNTLTDLAWIDYDNDGDLDLAESGWLLSGYTPATFVFRNNFITNSFTGIVTNLPGGTNIADGAMAWADYNNDGRLDLLLSGETDTYHIPNAFTLLYRNRGGVFTNSGAALPALVKGAAAWGDFDNDGDLDLLIAGQTGSSATSSLTRIYRNDGNGVFTAIAASFPGVTECTLAWGDFNSDGNLDFAMAGMGTNSIQIARIYQNLGNGVFTNLNANLAGVTFASLAWGDYDCDGFLDLAVSGANNLYPSGAVTKVYQNNGGLSFTDIGGTLPSVALQNLSWEDYDNDGDLDILVGTHLCRNNWNIPNTPPTAPTNLTFVILSNNDVRLAWSTSSDLETTNPRGLSYNVRIGTISGGGQIMSPWSSIVNGYHRVPNFGNAGPTNLWRIDGLTNGTYYWSVQAIDPTLAGSPFATEASFTLTRPAISAITNRSTPPNTVVGPITFTVSDVETAASNLIVTASSSDTNLVAVDGLALGGADTNRTLTITPVMNRSGFTIITVTALDESGQFMSGSFVLTVELFGDLAAGLSPLVGPVTWGDFDSDGNLDLVKGNFVYRNLGNGVFTNVSAGIGPNEGFSGWGDYNGDGNPDLLVIGANACKVYRTDGNGNFTDINAGLPAAVASRQSGVWGDFDNDGDPDILIAGASFSRVYRNNGTNAFTDILAGLPTVANGSVASCDYDKDGDQDILLAGNGLMRIYRNNGNGTFTDASAGLPTIYYASVAWGDYDNDGWPDIAVCGSTNKAVSGVVTRIYHSYAGATRSFTNLYPTAALGPAGVWKGAVAWGDFDNDGDLDLLVTGETANSIAFTRIYWNDNGAFTDSGYTLPALKNSFAAWGDFDNDGSLDLALSGNDATSASIARIYRNYSNAASNMPPSAPLNLTNVVFRKSVRLSWNRSDDVNQPAGLGYNLRLGTSPGSGNIVSSLSDSSGTRKVVAPGNANERQSWTITNLTGGTFYWSVQAVDHSFAGSAFATERSFVVTNLAPVAVTKFVTTAEDISVGIALTGSDPDNDTVTLSLAGQPMFGTLSGSPPNVTYRPVTNYFGFDQFSYRANDRTTDSAPASVFITVSPVQDVNDSSLAIAPTAGGQYRLSLSAEPWHSYRIEASEDLVHWTPITNFFGTNLLTQIIDADAVNFSQRFYRAALFAVVPAIDSGAQWASNQFQFYITGEASRAYQIQASTNLSDWLPIGTLVMTNAQLPFIDRDAKNFPQRFYRIVSP